MKHAKHVIVSTPSLGDEVRKYNEHVTDIVATFNTKRFLAVPDYVKKDTTVIGWTGSHSTLQYLHLLDNVFKRLSKLRKIKVLVICNAIYQCEGVDVENVQWTEANEVSDLHRIDIGVYPVPFDTWVLGKSGCKTITYMTCAIPSVSTEYGNVVTQVVDKNVNGLLVKTEDEWIEALCKLIDDVNLRREIGTKARAKVESHFSIEATKQKYLNILNSVAG